MCVCVCVCVCLFYRWEWGKERKAMEVGRYHGNICLDVSVHGMCTTFIVSLCSSNIHYFSIVPVHVSGVEKPTSQWRFFCMTCLWSPVLLLSYSLLMRVCHWLFGTIIAGLSTGFQFLSAAYNFVPASSCLVLVALNCVLVCTSSSYATFSRTCLPASMKAFLSPTLLSLALCLCVLSDSVVFLVSLSPTPAPLLSFILYCPIFSSSVVLHVSEHHWNGIEEAPVGSYCSAAIPGRALPLSW